MAALSRYVWRIGRTLAVIVSLLTFPSMIPWMVACWLAWYTLLSSHNRSRLLLLACVGILLVKRVDWSPWLIAMAVLMLALCGYRWYAERKVPSPWNNRLAWLGIAGIWIAWAGVTYQWGRSPYAGRPLTIQPSRPIVCIGDSLTSFGYPKCLREKVSLPVRDLSYPGITSGEALSILPRLVEAKPQVVVIELGGHDYLQGNGRTATRRNLDKIVDVARSIGAEIILMEIPRGFVMDAYDGLERQMARQEGLELVPDTAIRKLVLWSSAAPPGTWVRPEHRLSDDGLHPNARGNKVLAEYVADALARIYGPAVRANR